MDHTASRIANVLQTGGAAIPSGTRSVLSNTLTGLKDEFRQTDPSRVGSRRIDKDAVADAARSVDDALSGLGSSLRRTAAAPVTPT